MRVVQKKKFCLHCAKNWHMRQLQVDFCAHGGQRRFGKFRLFSIWKQTACTRSHENFLPHQAPPALLLLDIVPSLLLLDIVPSLLLSLLLLLHSLHFLASLPLRLVDPSSSLFFLSSSSSSFSFAFSVALAKSSASPASQASTRRSSNRCRRGKRDRTLNLRIRTKSTNK